MAKRGYSPEFRCRVQTLSIPRGMLAISQPFPWTEQFRRRPAVVTIDRNRRRKRVELTNEIFEYIEIFHDCSIDTWRLV
jgi:hypothetical protein